MSVVTVGRDFSRFPGGRYRTDGPFSGQQFREEYLTPPLRRGESVSLRLEGASGYPSSFLEEAFGGLIREDGFSATDIRTRLSILVSDASFAPYKALIWKYIEDADRTSNPHVA